MRLPTHLIPFFDLLEQVLQGVKIAHRKIEVGRACVMVLKYTAAGRKALRLLKILSTRHKPGQENIHSIDPDVFPGFRGDQVRFFKERAGDAHTSFWRL